jgi:hypothetical protein
MKREREYLAKAKRCEERATKMRRPGSREWQLILARAYRILAEAEREAAAQVNRRECSRASILVGSATLVPASSPAAPTSRAGDSARVLSGQALRAV